MLLDGVIENSGAFARVDQPWGDAQLARLYDLFEFSEDVPMYLELAAETGGRVLEVACGSGRVLTQLVRAGFSVVGVDASPHMLEQCRAKLNGGPAELVQADMRSFDVAGRSFDLAIVAVKSLCYLVEPADQLACLQRIAEHLRHGGLLVLDLLHPRPDWVTAQPGVLRDDLLTTTPSGMVVSRVESVVRTDLAQQVRVTRSIYEVIDAHGKPVFKRMVEWPYRYIHRFEAEHLLARAGFRVEAVYGGYNREPFTSESATMLFVAGRV
ncbi:MAG: class I SAM-dependent methyltransferase [Chloroflexi bacterium]|nr:class I SAM-dependent methyltransferase [Chloroflexota bacterium]